MEPISIKALGTTWWIEVFDNISTRRRDGLTSSITALLLSIESRFSRFRDDSLIGILNRERQLSSTDTDLVTLIQHGRMMYRETRELFNILIGDALIARGYDSEYSLEALERVVEVGNPLTDLEYRDGVWRLSVGQIDLGGIGKGWAIDQLATLLRNEGIREFLINGGGDIYGTTEHGEPIIIYLEHPTLPATYLGTTAIMNEGFAASSPHKRRWTTKQGETNHIIGTHTSIDASFVIAQDALTADSLATTALITSSVEFGALATKFEGKYATFTLTTGRFNHSTHFPYIPL